MAKISKISLAGVVHDLVDAGVRADLKEFKESLATVYRYKGSVETYDVLTAKTGNEVGDVWNVESTGANYAWDGTKWDNLGESVDLSGYQQKEAGKGLSEANFTSAEKTKLAGIAEGATHVVVDEQVIADSANAVAGGGVAKALGEKANIASPTFTGTPKAPTAAAGTNTTQIATTAFVSTAVSNKVDKVSGKGLSTNDFTTALKTKLTNIAASVGSADTNGFSTLTLTLS